MQLWASVNAVQPKYGLWRYTLIIFIWIVVYYYTKIRYIDVLVKDNNNTQKIS